MQVTFGASVQFLSSSLHDVQMDPGSQLSAPIVGGTIVLDAGVFRCVPSVRVSCDILQGSSPPLQLAAHCDLLIYKIDSPKAAQKQCVIVCPAVATLSGSTIQMTRASYLYSRVLRMRTARVAAPL
jgi:hypothetical protein